VILRPTFCIPGFASAAALLGFYLAGVAALVAQERVAKLADAQAQLAYDAEVARLELSKLQAQFSSMLTTPHITLHSLTGNSSVSSFHDADIPQELQVRAYAMSPHSAAA